MPTRSALAPLALLALLALPPPAAVAETAGPLPAAVVAAEILPGWQTGEGTLMAALALTLAPGWKTYWRAPGETGIAPVFDWSGSANLAGVRLHWPRPVAIGGGLGASIGYEGRLVLPIEVVPARPGERVRLAAEVALGVCADLCVPVTLGLAADLAPPGRREPRIAAALADRPLSAGEAGVRGFSCRIEPVAAGGLRVAAEVLLPFAGEVRAAAFETADPGLWVSSARLAQGAGAVRASADILPAAPGPLALDRSALRLTLVGDDTAVELRGCPAG